MKIEAMNPGMGQSFEVDYDDFSFTTRKQIDSMEPRELELILPRGVPVTQFAQIRASEQGIIQFRGYVETYRIDSKKTKTLDCVGMEALLNQRYAQPYFYPIGTLFSTLFSDTCTDLALPGLMAQANGNVPPGIDYTIYNVAENIIKIANGGTKYRFSNHHIYAIDYRYLRKLDEASLLADLVPLDNTYYQDDTDIYIKIDNHYHRGWEDLGGLLVDSAFDTTCRLGNITPSGKSLSGELQTDMDPIGDLIVDTAIGHKYYVHFRDDENFTYIDLDDEEGR